MITLTQRRKVLRRIDQAEGSLSILRNKVKGRLDAAQLDDAQWQCKQILDLVGDARDLLNRAYDATVKR